MFILPSVNNQNVSASVYGLMPAGGDTDVAGVPTFRASTTELDLTRIAFLIVGVLIGRFLK